MSIISMQTANIAIYLATIAGAKWLEANIPIADPKYFAWLIGLITGILIMQIAMYVLSFPKMKAVMEKLGTSSKNKAQ